MDAVQEGIPQALPSESTAQQHTRRKRGLLLTLILIYVAFYIVIGLYSALILSSVIYVGNAIWLSVLGLAVLCGILIGLWRWKKIAVYGLIFYVIYSVIAPVIGLAYKSVEWPIYLLSIVGTQVPFLLLLWAIRKKWSYFH